MTLNSINLNNNVSNDCGSPSIEINKISLSNITLNNHLSSDNIGNRVKARNEKARKKKFHKKSQHFKARNLENTSSPESLSYYKKFKNLIFTLRVTSPSFSETIYIMYNNKDSFGIIRDVQLRI